MPDNHIIIVVTKRIMVTSVILVLLKCTERESIRERGSSQKWVIDIEMKAVIVVRNIVDTEKSDAIF